jgi:hypothetical protein
MAVQKQAQPRRLARTAQGQMGCPRLHAARRGRLPPDFLSGDQASVYPHGPSPRCISTVASAPDVKNAFLHGELAERVYCHQPTGFIDAEHPDHVCLLIKSLYGLRQAPRAWFERLGGHLRTIGFKATGSDSSLFVLKCSTGMSYLLVYVDDIILTASSDALLRQIINQLQSAFAIKDLGPLRFFLGVQVRRDDSGFFLTQDQYAEEILERAGMANCKAAITPVDTKPKISITDGEPVSDATFYRSIAGTLQYLTLARPDIDYAHYTKTDHFRRPMANRRK